MNIINWLYLKRQQLIKTTINDSATDLLLLGAQVPFTTRDDGYQDYAMTVQDFANQVAAAGPVGPQGPTGPQGVAGPVGPAGLNWQGAWSALSSYVVDDAVGYGGASYFCINPVGPSVTTPDLDTVNWALLASQGSPGPQGPQGVAANAPAIIVADAADGIVVTGTTSPTISKSYLITANTLKTNSILEVSWGVLRTTASSTVQSQMYINTSNTLVGATLIATGANQSALLNGYLRNIRDIQKVNTAGSVYNASNQSSSDLGIANSQVTTFTLDNAVNLYLIFAIANSSAADSASINRVRVTEY